MERLFDLVIIGGGVTGAGLFSQAARRGLSVLLLEKGRPGAQTTGVSSGLVHGGLRYLTYDLATSIQSSREAGLLRSRYPDLLRRQVFLWPVYRGDPHGLEAVESLLEYYDRLAHARGARPHTRLSPSEALELEPALGSRGLLGALTFDEWAVEAVALVERLMQEGIADGGILRSGAAVTGFNLAGRRIEEVNFAEPGGGRGAVRGRVVVNATGPWAELTARLAGCRAVRLTHRKGVHLVVEGRPSRYGLIFPDAAGRYLGLYPRPNEAWIGPTDDPFEGPLEQASGTPEEARRLWEAARKTLPGLPPASRTVAGVRPILAQNIPGALSRDYRVFDHAREGVDNLVSVTGGKLTLFRPMALETLRVAAGKLPSNSRAPGPDGTVRSSLLSRSRLVSFGAAIVFLAGHALLHAFRRLARLKGPGREEFRGYYGGQ